MPRKTIFTGFAPNLMKQDVQTACSFLCNPVKWKLWHTGPAVKQAREWLKSLFTDQHITLFDSGRTGLQVALEALGVGEGDEVILQAYTCIVVSNAIIWAKAKPIYVDVQDDFNMNPADVIKKITPKTKALIVQHTFGSPALIEEILAIAKEYNIPVIEDCAHALGAKHKGKLLGTWGDIGMFSFGSDKIISCVRGGALITKREDLAKKLELTEKQLHRMSRHILFQHLMHFPIFSIGKRSYGSGIGKAFFAITGFLGLTNRVIYSPEKHAEQVQFFPSAFPNALAQILLHQAQQLEKVNNHRQLIARLYKENIVSKQVIHPPWNEESVYLRYTIRIPNSEQVIAKAKEQGILLGFWYRNVIDPWDIDMTKTGYQPGSCPNAERLAKDSVNLPTNRFITEEDVKRIINVVNSIVN